MSMSQKNETGGSFAASVIFILSVALLIVLFVLFTRNQNTQNVKETLSTLAESNAELRDQQTVEKNKPVAEKLKESGLDPERVWKMEMCENTPYCTFTQVDGSASFSIERWDGYFLAKSKEEGDCDKFVMEGAETLPIDMSLLASVEQNLLKASTQKDPVGVSVIFAWDGPSPLEDETVDVCKSPARVLNVHFE